MFDVGAALNLGEELISVLEKIYQLFNPPTAAAMTAGGNNPPEMLACERDGAEKLESPSLLQLRRQFLAIHARRHLVTELAATGKLSTSEAQALVDDGADPLPNAHTAGSTPFANVLAWLQANGSAIAADIAAAIPLLISLITLFDG